MNNGFPKNFRKMPIRERRDHLKSAFHLTEKEMEAIDGKNPYLEVTDVMIESGIGLFPVPLGLATGFLIDQREYSVPMATEEPSVIAAASHGARIVAAGGGFHTWATDPVMTAQLYIEGVPAGEEEKIYLASVEIGNELDKSMPSMKARGGGYRGLEVTRLPVTGLVNVNIDIDVRDAMGANVVNTAAEKIRSMIEKISGGKILMSILTNTAPHRRAGASFRVPFRFLRYKDFLGSEIASKIELASHLGLEAPSRAVTHNKGIMNGIVALTLATGNDTRAVESAAHHYASISGAYKALSRFEVKDGNLEGSLEIPLPLGTVGGAVTMHPGCQTSMKILGNPDAQILCRIAAALGLAQNLAALLALVSEGIQQGHMKLHASRIAYMVGARGKEIKVLVKKMWESGTLAAKAATKLLDDIRGKE